MFGFLRGSLPPSNESPGKRLICILITDNHYWSQTSKKPRAGAGVESGETNKQLNRSKYWWRANKQIKGCKRTNTTNQSLTLCTGSLGTQCVQSYQGGREGYFSLFPPPQSDVARWSGWDQIGVVIQFVIQPPLHCTHSFASKIIEPLKSGEGFKNDNLLPRVDVIIGGL